MTTSIMARGAEAGTRWALRIARKDRTPILLGALDHMFDTNVWDYRLIYTEFVQCQSSSNTEFVARMSTGQAIDHCVSNVLSYVQEVMHDATFWKSAAA